MSIGFKLVSDKVFYHCVQIWRDEGKVDKESFVDYCKMQGLHIIEMRKALKKGNLDQVDYSSEELQIYYMLVYYTIYTYPLQSILKRGRGTLNLPLHEGKLVASFIGAGPAPEVLGLLSFLENYQHKTFNAIEVNMLDQKSEEWSYSRSITTEHLIPSIWKNLSIAFNSKTLDIASKIDEASIAKEFGRSSIVVMQNCLNEVSESALGNVNHNLQAIFKALPANALLVVIDVVTDEKVTNFLFKFWTHHLLDSGSSGLCNPDGTKFDPKDSTREPQNQESTSCLVDKYILTGGHGGLNPKKNCRYAYLVLERANSAAAGL